MTIGVPATNVISSEGLRADMDGKGPGTHETLSREISCLNAPCANGE